MALQRTRSQFQAAATRVSETAVIAAPVDAVWAAVRPLNFTWSRLVAGVNKLAGEPDQGEKESRQTEIRFFFSSLFYFREKVPLAKLWKCVLRQMMCTES